MSLLSQVLKDKLIPWARSSAEKRFVVARPVMKRGQLPDNVQIERQKIPGKRVIVKGHRDYANTRLRSARWSEAGLHEVENPKLICTLRGRAAYQINEYLMHAGEGAFLFIPPGTPHPDGTAPHLQNNSGYCELFNVVLYRGAVQCWTCYSENNRHFGHPSENYLLRDEKVVRLFQLLAEEAIEGNDNSQLVCENLLTAFFTVLLRELQAGRYSHPGSRTTYEAPLRATDDFTTTLQEYIQAHLHESLTLENAARQMHLSRAQFARQVKQETGSTFVEILTLCRIEEAKSLLRESDWTSSAIAKFVGFKSVTYFHDLFTRRAGSTPGQFRQAARKARHSQI